VARVGTYAGRTGFGWLALGVLLACYIALVYLAGVVATGTLLGVGTHNAWLTLASTAVVAVTFERATDRARRAVNRLLYGERATPLDVLSHISQTETTSDNAMLQRMARLVADGTGAARAEVWIAFDGAFDLASSHPEAAGSVGRRASLPEGDLVVPVRHRGEVLGALVVVKDRGEHVTPAEERLLHDVASQAGLALRNVRLRSELARRIDEIAARAEELRASRRRVVATQDSERRRLERDIHDGAQQHLVALAVKLRLTRTLVVKNPAQAAGLFAELKDVTSEAIANLRDLTRGIYPPVLAEDGIGAALGARAERSPIPVAVDATGVRRYPLAVEAAVYFACLEALQNALKHSRATRIDVRLRETPFGIAFRVADDGAGFDAAAIKSGSGFVNLTDRIAAIGGTIDVESEPGRGTIVSGEVPAAAVAS
jgi:signal transduction histidine kinase